MPPNTIPQLSKSKFAGGLQCLKRLYLECFDRKLADPIDASQQALFDSGNAVGELARQRFPGGRLINEPYFEHEGAVASTREALDDSSLPSLYEAAFAHEGIRIRTDVLLRTGDDGLDLIEVKSSTKVKPEHIPDIAIQLYVLEGSGILVRKAFLLHIDNSYVYQGGAYNLERLFRLDDVTNESHAFLASTVPESLAGMWEVLQQEKAPPIDTGPHCNTPYQCPFFGHCHRDEPEHSVEQLPRVTAKVLDALKSRGIRAIQNIPSEFPGLSSAQQRVRDAVITGDPYVSADLPSALGQVSYPIYFLDFETFNPALPIYPGTRPYQMIPFQWSVHGFSKSGQLQHESFLADDSEDPREKLTTSLLDALGKQGTILVYSSFERTRVKELAALFPEYAARLSALVDRFVDLLTLVRTHVYHPDFHGSYSIKAVLPALAPDLGYGDLEIQEGSLASVAFAKMIAPDTDDSERQRVRHALLAYCQRDTEAMVWVYNALRQLAA